MLTDICAVLRFEPIRLRYSPVVILTGAFTLLFALAVLPYIWRAAEQLLQLQAPSDASFFISMVLSKFADPSVRELLFSEAPLLGLFFVWATLVTPWLALLLGSDLVSSDLGRRHIRFILPRIGTTPLLLGRVGGACIAWCFLMAVLLTGAMLTLGPLEQHADIGALTLLWLRMLVLLSLYGFAFIALGALFNALLPNASLVYLAAVGVWLAIAAAASIAGFASPAFAYLGLLVPTSVKYALLSADISRVTLALAGIAAYTAVFVAIALMVLRRRDV